LRPAPGPARFPHTTLCRPTAYPGLPAPTLLSPSNGASSQLTTPMLMWSSVSGATLYRVEVATSASALTTDTSTTCPGPCVVDTTTSSTTLTTPTLQPGSTD